MNIQSSLPGFSNSTIYFGQPLYEWVKIIHTNLTKEYDMEEFKIEPNDYGFDSYASIINVILSNVSSAEIFDSIKGNINFEKFVRLAHIAWSNNYIRWKGIRCDKIGKNGTIGSGTQLGTNPKKTLNTIDRNNRATTMVEYLDDKDLEMYTDVIIAVFSLLEKKILNAGMQQLSIST
jgi:hypothetical protein